MRLAREVIATVLVTTWVMVFGAVCKAEAEKEPQFRLVVKLAGNEGTIFADGRAGCSIQLPSAVPTFKSRVRPIQLQRLKTALVEQQFFDLPSELGVKFQTHARPFLIECIWLNRSHRVLVMDLDKQPGTETIYEDEQVQRFAKVWSRAFRLCFPKAVWRTENGVPSEADVL